MSVKSSQKFSGFVQWFIRLQQLKEMQSSKLGMTEGGTISYTSTGKIPRKICHLVRKMA